MSATAVRLQIEAALSKRIPSALTPMPRSTQPVVATGISPVDELLRGGLPLGTVTEIVGGECSGRTSLAISFVAQMTSLSRVCAWVDVSNTLDPESAAAAGVDLSRLLWVRCGVASPSSVPSPYTFALSEGSSTALAATKKSVSGGGQGTHPRSEVTGLASAVKGLLAPQGSLLKPCSQTDGRYSEAAGRAPTSLVDDGKRVRSSTPWSRLEDALRVTDLLLQGGGFSAIVLDMGSAAPEYVLRVPLATWFRYRAAAERTQGSVLLLTQQACAKSSAGLVLGLKSGEVSQDGARVLTGMDHRLELVRQRFAPAVSNVVPMRKPPQSANATHWESRAAWAVNR